MEVYLGLEGLPEGIAAPVVTIGAFDGIHRGHQQLLGRVNARAEELGGSGMLVTFEPHPQRVIAPGTAPPLLTSREEKIPLLARTGLDAVVILPFNRELSEMEAEEFVTTILKGAIGVRFLVLGHDHAFGKGRRGRPELLRQMAQRIERHLRFLRPVLLCTSGAVLPIGSLAFYRRASRRSAGLAILFYFTFKSINTNSLLDPSLIGGPQVPTPVVV